MVWFASQKLGKCAVGVDKIIYCAEFADLRYTVARIVVAVFLNLYLHSTLNGNSDEPVLRVIGVGRGLIN